MHYYTTFNSKKICTCILHYYSQRLSKEKVCLILLLCTSHYLWIGILLFTAFLGILDPRPHTVGFLKSETLGVNTGQLVPDLVCCTEDILPFDEVISSCWNYV